MSTSHAFPTGNMPYAPASFYLRNNAWGRIKPDVQRRLVANDNIVIVRGAHALKATPRYDRLLAFWNSFEANGNVIGCAVSEYGVDACHRNSIDFQKLMTTPDDTTFEVPRTAKMAPNNVFLLQVDMYSIITKL